MAIDVEKLFYSDVKDKKRQKAEIQQIKGLGRRRRRNVTTPYDYLSATEKRQLNSKVRRYSMYQSLMTIDELRRNPDYMQTMIVEKWREVHTNDAISDALGIGKKAFYDLLEELNVKKKPRGGATRGQGREPVPVEGIPTYEEFETLDEDSKKEMMVMLRNEFKTEDIKKAWGMSTGGFYAVLNKLGVETSTRNHKKPVEVNMAAQLGDMSLLPYKKFRSLPEIQQAELFDEYVRRYSTVKDLADAWGVAIGTIYGFSGKLKKIEYTPTPKEEILKAKKPSEEEVVNVEASPEEEVKQLALEAVESGVSKEKFTEFLESKREELVEEPQEELTEQVEESSPSPTMEEQMKQLLDQLTKQQETIDKQAQQIARLYHTERVDMVAPTQPVPVEPTPTEGFAMKYEKTTEGFMAHVDVKRFISMLEKNPDTFKVNISITRIEA
ncbi:hypothetical protein SAMN04487777_11742 [Priestia aryabhattai B8W22]|uniref:hypothetical protein n=1 Tax=Priestia aryabhattai TaxID=412384 RepID=UPI00088383CB|nr:hypothetical protein SAMN04487777_11742 [Priestia aryabhattai B8W22]